METEPLSCPRCAERTLTDTPELLKIKNRSQIKTPKAATAEHLDADEGNGDNDENNVNLGNSSGRRPFATPATASSAAQFLNSALEGAYKV